MIPRYTREEMASLWSEDNKLRMWFEVELAAVEGWAQVGMIPSEAAEHIRKHAVLDIERIAEIEAVTHHDVAAFVQSLEESVGQEFGRWIHFGMTSSDVLDTAFACQLRDAADILIDDVNALMDAIKKRAYEHRDVIMIGRSHGIHAEATTFGHMLAIWFDEMRRSLVRLQDAKDVIAYGKVSGAVGTFANIPPEVEAYVCEKLGLKPAPASSQIVQRDRHAQFFTALGLVASTLEKFAVQIRHMQRTEVLEVEERFRKGQKGSSAMPHKRNPVLSENITGLARTVRAYVTPAMENVALWHERDISHSSVERVIAPDATALLDFALRRMTRVVDELVVYPENMMANFQQTRGLPFSQGVLLALIQAGLSRQDAYQQVQRLAMRAWEERLDFEQLVRNDEQISSYLSNEVMNQCFDLKHALRHIQTIFNRVFEQTS